MTWNNSADHRFRAGLPVPGSDVVGDAEQPVPVSAPSAMRPPIA